MARENVSGWVGWDILEREAAWETEGGHAVMLRVRPPCNEEPPGCGRKRSEPARLFGAENGVTGERGVQDVGRSEVRGSNWGACNGVWRGGA